MKNFEENLFSGMINKHLLDSAKEKEKEPQLKPIIKHDEFCFIGFKFITTTDEVVITIKERSSNDVTIETYLDDIRLIELLTILLDRGEFNLVMIHNILRDKEDKLKEKDCRERYIEIFPRYINRLSKLIEFFDDEESLEKGDREVIVNTLKKEFNKATKVFNQITQ